MSVCLDEHESAQLRDRIKRLGLDATATELGMNATTLLRAACGLQLHSATRTVISDRMRQYAEKA